MDPGPCEVDPPLIGGGCGLASPEVGTVASRGRTGG